jgi:pyruvate/2-oxoglutarate dehydrogenase complex dihydrolipoamide dehydrogenase (E3) component
VPWKWRSALRCLAPTSQSFNNLRPCLRPNKGDPEAATILQEELEKDGVHFVSGTTKKVTTLRECNPYDTTQHQLMKVTVGADSGDIELECECLLVAVGRIANVENLGPEEAGVEYELGKGITVNDHSQSVSNPNIFAVGD